MKQKQIVELANVLSVAGFNANIWKGFRVYLNGYGKDIKAYFELDDPDSRDWVHVMDDAALKVFTNAHRSIDWRLNRCKEVKHRIMKQLELRGVVQSVCKSAKEVIL